MKAIIYDTYGPAEVLRTADIPRPTPGAGEVLVRVMAAALNPKDVLVRKGKFKIVTRQRFPRVPGYDFSGEVETVGQGVGTVGVGAPVFGMVQAWDGGTCAEYVVLPEGELAVKPHNIGFEEAAALPLASLTALQGLRDMLAVGHGTRVCINGASGGVGTMAVQIARILGAEVVAVCSRKNADLVRGLGADSVVAYDEEDPLRPDVRYGAFFDVFGNHSAKAVEGALTTGGRYCSTVPNADTVGREVLARVGIGAGRLVVVRSNRADLDVLRGWVESGKLEAVIDRVLPLSASIEAHQHLETRRATGKVVLSVSTP